MSDTDDEQIVDVDQDSEGWDDVEDEIEDLNIKSLFSDKRLPNLADFITFERSEHDFDLPAIKLKHDLDFYGSIKLVNYIRSEVKAGRAKIDTDNPAAWSDERYLQPVLENDALLFSLDDIDTLAITPATSKGKAADHGASSSVVADLEARLAHLQMQFDAYREQVNQTLDKRWLENEPEPRFQSKSVDDHYFEGYSYNDIHQTMLQDTVRTDAYRDFIYDNKHLFKDKVVMDVGCGTGILSMFCAKAGAKKVIAVDNSAIIDKARQITFDNGFEKTIIFVKSKLEDITELPDGLKHVDIIVSEWMGYCLLFEAMLPSVLVARDRFLKRSADGSTFDGLIIPSHCNLVLAPLSDEEWMADNVSFWKDVYGFDMHCMLEKTLDDVIVRLPPAEAICGKSSSKTDLKIWDLYTTKVEDLTFEAPFSVALTRDVDAIDSWCIWFDMGFSLRLPSEAKQVQSIAEIAKQPGAVTFSTSPAGKYTHWQAGVCVIDWDETQSSYAAGEQIHGVLTYSKGDGDRALTIDIAWKDKSPSQRKQIWKLS